MDYLFAVIYDEAFLVVPRQKLAMTTTLQNAAQSVPVKGTLRQSPQGTAAAAKQRVAPPAERLHYSQNQ